MEQYCLNCGRIIRSSGGFSSLFHTDDVLCSYCRKKMNAEEGMINVNGMKVNYLYKYAGLCRDLMIQYKENNDEALFPVFLWPFMAEMKRKYRGYDIVCVPSSRENNEERGFNAVRKIYSVLGLPFRDVLFKTENVSQKNLGHQDRSEIGKYIAVDPAFRGNRVLLADDIITTGNTLMSCHELLKDRCRTLKTVCVCCHEAWLNKK